MKGTIAWILEPLSMHTKLCCFQGLDTHIYIYIYVYIYICLALTLGDTRQDSWPLRWIWAQHVWAGSSPWQKTTPYTHRFGSMKTLMMHQLLGCDVLWVSLVQHYKECWNVSNTFGNATDMLKKNSILAFGWSFMNGIHCPTSIQRCPNASVWLTVNAACDSWFVFSR